MKILMFKTKTECKTTEIISILAQNFSKKMKQGSAEPNKGSDGWEQKRPSKSGVRYPFYCLKHSDLLFFSNER